MPKIRSSIAVCVFILLCSTAAVAQQPRAYYADDLGTLGGAELLAAAMNSHGDVVGYGTAADGIRHAFRWTRTGGLEDLGTFGGLDARATGINDNGDVLGFYLDAQFVWHSFFLPAGGTPQPVGGVFQPSRLGANGWFTGMSVNGLAFRAVMGGPVQNLGEFLGFGFDVNGRGDTAGYSWHEEPSNPGSQPTAFRYSDAAGFENLGTFGGTWSYAYAINATGAVVGEASTADDSRRAFRAIPGSPMQNLGLLFEDEFSGTVAYGVNSAGDVVGQAFSSFNIGPFRYTDGEGMVNLTQRIPIAARAHGVQYSAVAINDNKEILAIYYDGTGTFRSELLRPRSSVNPPSISSLSASPDVLSDVNGQMVPVTIDAIAVDEYDESPECRITYVFDSAAPFAFPNHDVQITGPLTVNLRARRDHGRERTYAVVVKCSNYFGKSVTRLRLVTVPGR